MKFKRCIIPGAGILLFTGIIWTNIIVNKYEKYTFNELKDINHEYCAIVLGTSKYLKNNVENRYYMNRIDAAAKLYNDKKCSKIIVSGDNRKKEYNEPLDMKQDLIKKGVRESDIVCDYAGTRTLDSIVRFKEVFGQTKGIVVSQKFHNNRAIYIARNKGIDLTGFNAEDVHKLRRIKTKTREIISKFFCVLDVKIFHTSPRHLGEKIEI